MKASRCGNGRQEDLAGGKRAVGKGIEKIVLGNNWGFIHNVEPTLFVFSIGKFTKPELRHSNYSIREMIIW